MVFKWPRITQESLGFIHPQDSISFTFAKSYLGCETCIAQVILHIISQISWEAESRSNLKRIQQNAEIELLLKLNYIPWFMGKYFMCHKFETLHIKSLHNREMSGIEKEKFNF